LSESRDRPQDVPDSDSAPDSESKTISVDVPTPMQILPHRPIPIDEYEKMRDARDRLLRTTEQKKWSVVNRLLLALFAFVFGQSQTIRADIWMILSVILILILTITHICEFRS